jgi:hypothetical protein
MHEGTFLVPGDQDPVDVTAFLLTQDLEDDRTPQHTVILQNNGSEPIYLGSSVIGSSTTSRYSVAPGKEFRLTISRDHLYAAAASDVTAGPIAALLIVE